ncbi:hypothetical protein [Sinorhizobium mexicanum]|uniref:hypothetical protein n=1 Tax=Sinorhizobium mexicanum TaxID=375549 RepID=UPI0015DE42D4|nr:hypothetical protein [Sinorhizobium mexicanum]MBP1884304.1 hypothetical protein [Sinorhizobium mexicanum]
MTDYLWLLVTAGGAFALGAALAYVVMRQRPLPRALKEAQERKVRELYRESQEDQSQ